MFYTVSVLKHFINFTGKHLFILKLHIWSLQLYWKETPEQVFFLCEFCKITFTHWTPSVAPSEAKILVESICIQIHILKSYENHSSEIMYRTSHQRCSIKMVFLKIPQNSQGITCAGDLLKKENLALVFCCEFWEIFKNTFFTVNLGTTASAYRKHFSNSYLKGSYSCSPIIVFCVVETL